MGLFSESTLMRYSVSPSLSASVLPVLPTYHVCLGSSVHPLTLAFRATELNERKLFFYLTLYILPEEMEKKILGIA